VVRLVADVLRQRVRADGARRPLVTYYDLATGERTELSARSFLNWVDKTSNLLVDELQLGPGAVIDVELARSAPGHWVTLVIELAAWQVGATVRMQTAAGPAADLLVLGPDWETTDIYPADAVLACSLHPLGLGFSTPLPPALTDFSLAVRGQSDLHLPTPLAGSEVAWVDDNRRLTQTDLVMLDRLANPVGPCTGGPARRLVQVSDPWSTTRDGLLAPLLTGGSAVLVRGEDPGRLSHIRRDERAEG